MSDVWDEESEPSSLKQIERKHHNAGYLDGITKEKEKNHQPGFDDGYIEGAEIGLQVGKIIGTFQALGLEDLELMATKHLSVPELFCAKYYNREARPLFQGTHPLVAEWQKRADSFTFTAPNEK